RGEFDELDVQPFGQQHGGVEELPARLFGDASREKPVAFGCGRVGAAVRVERKVFGQQGRAHETGTSSVSKIVRTSSTLGMGLTNGGGILPFAAMRRPSGATLSKPRTLKRPIVP